jgi:hypothetical protein
VAGLRFNGLKGGKPEPLRGGEPTVREAAPGRLGISWPLGPGGGTLVLEIDERSVAIRRRGGRPMDWCLDLTAAPDKALPFVSIQARRIGGRFLGRDYEVAAEEGLFSQPGGGIVFRIKPENGRIRLRFAPPDQAGPSRAGDGTPPGLPSRLGS